MKDQTLKRILNTCFVILFICFILLLYLLFTYKDDTIKLQNIEVNCYDYYGHEIQGVVCYEKVLCTTRDEIPDISIQGKLPKCKDLT